MTYAKASTAKAPIANACKTGTPKNIAEAVPDMAATAPTATAPVAIIAPPIARPIPAYTPVHFDAIPRPIQSPLRPSGISVFLNGVS